VLDGIVPRLTAVGMASSIALAIARLLGTASIPAARFADAWLGASAALVLGGVIVGLVHRVARFRWLSGQPALIIGTGDVGTLLAVRLERYRGHGLRPIGMLDDGDPDPVMTPYGPLPILGAIEDLVDVARLTGARHVILAFTATADRDIGPVLREARDAGLEVSVVPRQFESVNDRVNYENVVGVPMLRLTSAYSSGAGVAVKALLDRALAVIGVIVCAPVLALLALAVKLSSPGPVLFRQRRIGLDGAEFEMLKFRSMRACPDGIVAVPAAGQMLASLPVVAPGGVEGVDRRTRLGRLLRRTSLDELPQLFNVVRGEMSLVGPRPERPEFARRFGDQLPRYEDRHRVKSGITGWAQVHGLRGRTSLSDRIDWDNYYIEHWSLWLDLRILLLTPLAVLRKAE
jgi:exopolysaccharide biosynthesis polyprenyl glycosylphosphotransferase